MNAPTHSYPEAVIFDCDGVLVDTEGLKATSMMRMLENRGITISREDLKSFMGYSAEHILDAINARFATSFDFTIYDDFDKFYAELRQNGVTPLHRNVALARELHKLGIPLGLASSDSHLNITKNLSLTGLKQLFSVVVSGIDELPRGSNKPHPLIYETAMARLGSTPQRTVVIEDTPPGCEAGYRAGARVIALSHSLTEDRVFAPWATHHCRSTESLQAILDKILSILI